MKRYLKVLWRTTFEPVYRRLFQRYYVVTLREVKEMRWELYNHITRQGEVNAEVIAHLHELDRHVRTVIAAGWDDTALARRMASLEDRIERDGTSLPSEAEKKD
jgi:hypothetical protein